MQHSTESTFTIISRVVSKYPSTASASLFMSQSTCSMWGPKHTRITVSSVQERKMCSKSANLLGNSFRSPRFSLTFDEIEVSFSRLSDNFRDDLLRGHLNGVLGDGRLLALLQEQGADLLPHVLPLGVVVRKERIGRIVPRKSYKNTQTNFDNLNYNWL